MPLASALVGHGGFGTTMIGLAAGVPQVATPVFSADQFLNAQRIADEIQQLLDVAEAEAFLRTIAT